eukprot:CAMPEP_0172162030 /NCGR_PEP_ID=MMETSP1050-20130122/6443_1 /TAXON_ID=233186 /ORGANISM="Cryptomonas curvata, Strain CCAP979/52" /LENGTH=228 /DNA_ID=CAMNT_0012831971 /DNA_START=443 /DNA_END=1125 /DNA_ORIENTATION=+
MIWPVVVVAAPRNGCSPKPPAQKSPETKPDGIDDSGFIGIEFQPRFDRHFVVTEIARNGPSDLNEGVMIGDLILAVNGVPIRNLASRQIAMLCKHRAGTQVHLLMGAEFYPWLGRFSAFHNLLAGEVVKVARADQLHDDSLTAKRAPSLTAMDIGKFWNPQKADVSTSLSSSFKSALVPGGRPDSDEEDRDWDPEEEGDLSARRTALPSESRASGDFQSERGDGGSES